MKKVSPKPVPVRVIIDTNNTVMLVAIIRDLKRFGLEVHRGFLKDGQGVVDGEVPSVAAMTEIRSAQGVQQCWTR